MHSSISLVISLSSLYFINTGQLSPFIWLLSLVFIFDMVNNTIDMIIHHSIFFSLVLCTYLFNVHMPIDFYRNFMKVEISTIFLSLSKLTNRGFMQTINQYLFLITFTKYRVINLGYLFTNGAYNDAIIQQSPHRFATYFIYLNLYGFYLLNLYWFTLILRKLWRKLKKLKN